MIRSIIESAAKTVDVASFDVVEDFSARFPVEIITTMLGGCHPRGGASRYGTGSTRSWNENRGGTSAQHRPGEKRR